MHALKRTATAEYTLYTDGSGGPRTVSGTEGADVFTAYATGSGQIHIYADGRLRSNDPTVSGHWINGGDDILNLDFSQFRGWPGGHHVYGSGGSDIFNFVDVNKVGSVANSTKIVSGRIDDFDPTRDKIQIEGYDLDLNDLDNAVLPEGVRVKVIEYNGVHNDSWAHDRQWLVIETNTDTPAHHGVLLYALEGAQIDMDGDGLSNGGGQERHFLGQFAPTVAELQSWEAVEYINPNDTIPLGFDATDGLTIIDFDKQVMGVGNRAS